jgi:hypothetical protein
VDSFFMEILTHFFFLSSAQTFELEERKKEWGNRRVESSFFCKEFIRLPLYNTLLLLINQRELRRRFQTAFDRLPLALLHYCTLLFLCIYR